MPVVATVGTLRLAVCVSNSQKYVVWLGDERINFDKLALEINSLVSITDTAFSKYEYGPVLAIATWQADCKEPAYLLSNLTLAEEALWYYKKRFKMETLFSDTKTVGFALTRAISKNQSV